MNTVLIILAVAFGLAFLFILGSSLFASAWIFRLFNRTLTEHEKQLAAGQNSADERIPAGRAFELVARLPPDAEAYKCRKCGAIVDSTAELSANGEVRCTYCNTWSSIYQ